MIAIECNMSWCSWNCLFLGCNEWLKNLSLIDSMRPHLWIVDQSMDCRWYLSIVAPCILLTHGWWEWNTVHWFIYGPLCTSVVSNFNPVLWSFMNFLKCPTKEMNYGPSVHWQVVLHVRRLNLQHMCTCSFWNVRNVHRLTLSTHRRFITGPSTVRVDQFCTSTISFLNFFLLLLCL